MNLVRHVMNVYRMCLTIAVGNWVGRVTVFQFSKALAQGYIQNVFVHFAHQRPRPIKNKQFSKITACQERVVQKPSPIYIRSNINHLNQQTLDLILNCPNLVLQLRMFVASDRGGDDGASDTTSAAEGDFAGDKDVWDVLIFAQQGQVE